MKVLDLFSGIGAFSLGLERAGFQTVAFCEIDSFCRRVLAKHWPDVPCYDDVRSLAAERLRSDGIAADVICGGFPCQDISVAGKGAGIDGERSGLWREFARLIGEVGPRYVIVENVAALLGRGLGDVLGDLATLGYDAEWHCIPASAIGAPHQRDRIWIVAYSACPCRAQQSDEYDAQRPLVGAISGADGGDTRWYSTQGVPFNRGTDATSAPELANADSRRWREQEHVGSQEGSGAQTRKSERCSEIGHPYRTRLALRDGRDLARWAQASATGADWWAVEPDVGRVVDGTASKVDRRKRLIGLGNSLVPQIPELIGRAILQAETLYGPLAYPCRPGSS